MEQLEIFQTSETDSVDSILTGYNASESDSSESNDFSSLEDISLPSFLESSKKTKSKMSQAPWKPKKEKGPLQIEKSKSSYLYDKEGRTYIDCISGVSHVGHCHPKIVSVYQQQLGTIGTGHVATTPDQVWHNIQTNLVEKEAALSSPTPSLKAESSKMHAKEDMDAPKSKSQFINRLLKTLNAPDKLQTGLVFNSGSQANDIAIQLARAYTGNYDVIIFEESFHGGLSTGVNLSAKMMVKIDSKRERESSESSDVAQICKRPKIFTIEESSDDQSSQDPFEDQESSMYTSRSGQKSSNTEDPNSSLNLEDKENDETCCSEHSAMKKAPSYLNKPDWVHVLPIPDLKGGYYRHEDPSVAIEKYVEDAKTIINAQIRSGRKIACLISEPAFTFYNGMIPSAPYFEKISSYVREIGGVMIMDEVQTGLGRIGHYWWAFQAHNIIPDIVTAGKALNNGHPVSFLFTSQKILASLGQSLVDIHRPTSIQEALGNCVLDVMLEERLLDNCIEVGDFIERSVKNLMDKHSCISNLNGKGLMFGIEISSKDNKNIPNPNMAATIRTRLREKQIIVAVEGKNRNVVYIIPPMCFSKQNANDFIEALDEVIDEMGPEELEVKPITNAEPNPKGWSRKRNAHGRHPLLPSNRGMLRNHFFRPSLRDEEDSVTSFSFWNREGNDMSQDDNRERSLETNALGDNLSQPQYHFFSMRDKRISGSLDPLSTVEPITIANIRRQSSTEDENEGMMTTTNNEGLPHNTLSTPNIESSFGVYDDLD